jgi:hypothetical protein
MDDRLQAFVTIYWSVDTFDVTMPLRSVREGSNNHNDKHCPYLSDTLAIKRRLFSEITEVMKR